MKWFRSGGGTDTSDATATASDILSGKTAYVNDEKISGTFDFATATSGTATAGNVLSSKTAWVNGSKVTGTMTDQGAKTSTLNCGESYTIPAGYHNGSGKVTGNSLASQTSATATADDIKYGKTAYVNGEKITGNNYICTWADGTDEEIALMLEAHYNGELNIADYWSVGDKRTIHINAMSATGVSESHHADDYEFVIIGINHDNMTSGGKSAITVQMDRILYKNATDATYSSSFPASADEGGYMNSSNTNSGGWTSCKRRTWCNNVFFNALPSWVQALVKPVNKLTSAGNKSSIINTTSDKIFLPSEVEVFGTTTYSFAGEGVQYDYFKITTNRYKKPSYSTYDSAIWGERSPFSSSSTAFCVVNEYGNAAGYIATYCVGLAPVFCM